MKKLLIAAAVTAITCTAPAAFAQTKNTAAAKNFEGFSLGANVDWVRATPTNSGAAIDEENSANLGLEARYNFAIGSNFVLGLGATYEATKPKAGTTTGTTVSSRAKTASSLYVAPGYAISDSLQIYGKIAAVAATIEYDGTATTQDFSGLGYGVGVQSFMSKNWYIQGEVFASQYDYKTIAPGSISGGRSTILSMGVGYKF